MINTIIEALTFDFFQKSLFVGIVLAVCYAIWGNLVVLRKEALVGHSFSHIAFLGVAIAYLLNFNLELGAIVLTMFFAAVYLLFLKKNKTSSDSMLVILAQVAIAAAVILLSLNVGYKPDLMQFLFGSILAISNQDLLITLLTLLLTLILYFWKGKFLLQATVNSVLAKANNVNVFVYELVYLLVLALVVGLGIKMIGVVLLEALLVLPANIAKNIVRSFSGLVVISIVIAIVAMVIGLFASYALNIPSGATVVLILAVVMLLTTVFKKRAR